MDDETDENSETASASDTGDDESEGVGLTEYNTIMTTPAGTAQFNYDGQRNQLQQRHGTGMCTWVNGSVLSYQGQWCYDQPHGRGTMTFRNGSVYQ